MTQDPHLDYPAVCRYVGQLYLETRHDIELASRESAELRRRLAAAERERDEALALLAPAKREGG